MDFKINDTYTITEKFKPNLPKLKTLKVAMIDDTSVTVTIPNSVSRGVFPIAFFHSFLKEGSLIRTELDGDTRAIRINGGSDPL